MANLINLTVESNKGSQSLSIDIHRMFNVGGTMRDPKVFKRHLAEMAKEGITGPKTVPPLMPLGEWTLTTRDNFTVHSDKCSGEVEYVLLHLNSQWFIGAGSDHTDRDLEKSSIVWSKQVAPNVLAPTIWPLEEIKDHFDDIILESDVGKGTNTRPYQRTTLATFWDPDEMLRRISKRIPKWEGLNYLFFSGTVPTVNETLDFDTTFSFRMIDPVLDRTIKHSYTTQILYNEAFVDPQTIKL